MATPSLVMIPSGYKSEKVYSVIPSNGDGDFTFTREGASGQPNSTRVNKDGLIEEVNSNVPRLDYSDGSCPSLLLEPQSTNLITYSEDFSNAYWTKTGVSLSSSFASPSGDLSAYKVTENASGGAHALYNSTFSSLNGQSYTHSLFVKYNGRQWFRLWGQYGNSNFSAYFDIENGLLGSKDSGMTSKIEDYGNGWYRISATATTDGTISRFRGYLADGDGNFLYDGDGTSGVYIWGAQLEQLSYATSYIPTNGAIATRLADECNNAGNDQVINSSEGVLYAEIAALVTASGSDMNIQLNDGVLNNNSINILYQNSSAVLFQKYANGVRTTNLSISSIVKTDFNKIAIRYNATQVNVFLNGVNILNNADTNAFSILLNNLSFNRANNTKEFQGKVKEVRVYKEALTDVELQELTS